MGGEVGHLVCVLLSVHYSAWASDDPSAPSRLIVAFGVAPLLIRSYDHDYNHMCISAWVYPLGVLFPIIDHSH